MKGTLHHIELYVKDLGISLEFWGWLLERLGYKEFQSWQSGKSYILDKTYICFVQTEEQYLDIPYHRCRAGLNHISFHGGSKEFVDSITNELRIRGRKILYEDRHPYAGGEGYYAVFFEDPDRMKVEIVAD